MTHKFSLSHHNLIPFPFTSRYKSSLFPGNMETLTILNNSPMVVEAFFCFQNDVKASTYFLEPINMILKPNEKQVQSKGESPSG